MQRKEITPLICPSCNGSSIVEKFNGSLLYWECNTCKKAFSKGQMQDANSVIFRKNANSNTGNKLFRRK